MGATSINTCTNISFTEIKVRTIGCVAFFVLIIVKGQLIFFNKRLKHQTSRPLAHTFHTIHAYMPAFTEVRKGRIPNNIMMPFPTKVIINVFANAFGEKN